ncbi:MAG: DNA repair protein RecN [Chitinophagales bacterium]|nr:DNA repair protein RecN [Chitinophagales bacterium]
MLKKLYVQNYALIDRLDIHFADGMNIITGETGAGKSILLGALSLILGQRVNNAALPNNDQKCVVEGTFSIADYCLQAFFAENEIDYDHETILRREITASGKSRAFVNDTPVHLPILKQLSEQLVSLHAQHQTLHLYDANYHLFIIDALANHPETLTQYKQSFATYRQQQTQLNKLEIQRQQAQKDADYIAFQLNELAEARLENPNEQDELDRELDKLNNAESIKNALAESVYSLDDSDFSVLQQLKTIKNALNGIARYSADYEELAQRIDSTSIELRDLVRELSNAENNIQIDPNRAAEISERLNILLRLQKKHQVQNLRELMQVEADLAARNQSIAHLDDSILQLRQTLARQRQEIIVAATQISTQRQQQFATLEQQINELLAQVGMPKAAIKVAHRLLSEDALTANGMDDIELLFAANKGNTPAELRKVASGGELSRLMLCIQSLLAAHTALPTLIFDEIDTGISGEVALKVGVLMQKLALSHQVVCITHLPQIAAKGNRHFFVYKDDSRDDRTLSRIKTLAPDERVMEIAKMLSGDQPGQSAIANAKDLLRVSNV